MGPETSKPASYRPPDGFWAGGSLPVHTPTAAIMPPEDLVPCLARQIVAWMIWLHPGVQPPALWDSGDPVSAELFIEPLCPAGANTSAPNTMSQGIPSGTPCITAHPSSDGKLQPGGRQITWAEGPRALTPTVFTSSSPTVDVWGVATVDWRVASLCCITQHIRNVARTLTNAVWRSHLVESRKRAARAAKEIVSCLELASGTTQVLQGAYTILKRWYCHASARVTNTSRAGMAKFTGECAALYWREDMIPPGRPVTNHVTCSEPTMASLCRMRWR